MRLAEPIAFDAPDGKPVTQVFVLLVPEQATEKHLQLLSELAQMFSERSFREQLAAAPDADAVHALVPRLAARDRRHAMSTQSGMMRQVSVEQALADNQAAPRHELAGRAARAAARC